MTNKLGLPTDGADAEVLFNKEENKVETPASDEKVTETATSTDADVETKIETPAEEVIPVEPTVNEKFEIATKEFIKFLEPHSPEDAEKLAHQNKTGQAGYQQALNYAQVNSPEVVERWQKDRMFTKTAQVTEPVVSVPEQTAEEGEFDPYDANKMMNLMTKAIRADKAIDQQNQRQQYQQSQQEQIKAEAQEVLNQFSTLETSIKEQLGDELGSKIIADAFTTINNYGIDMNRVGGAMNYAKAFNDQLTIAKNSHNAELNKGKVETEQQAKISADLKKTMLQTQPAGSAADATDLSPQQKQLANMQRHKETSVSSSLKTLNT